MAVAPHQDGQHGRLRRLFEEWRPSAITLGAPAFPLVVLFGLNAVDELDRTAFAVLLPDIRDHFGLGDTAVLGLVAVSTIAVLFIEVPLSFYCDRRNRVRIATTGAALWALFSFGTGLSVSVLMLIAMRIGSGGGRAVVTPTHSSLLSDYYEPAARVKVFSAHRQANSVGQIIGPLAAGMLAYSFGWRAPFILFAVPTIVFVLLSMRLREPVRGSHERRAAGADEAAAAVEEDHEKAWATMRTLGRVRTVRRIWMAVPFLGIALFGIPNLLSLVYEDVFGLNAAARGAVAAGIEPLQIAGVFFGMPLVARIATKRPQFLLRFVAVVGVVDGALIVVLAYAPNVAVAIGVHALLAASIGTLAPAFFALVSLVSPPRVRSAAFSTMSVFAIPGIGLFLPLIGFVSDSLGIQASMVVMVPVSLAAGFILASASGFVVEDMAAVQAESLARVAGMREAADGSDGASATAVEQVSATRRQRVLGEPTAADDHRTPNMADPEDTDPEDVVWIVGTTTDLAALEDDLEATDAVVEESWPGGESGSVTVVARSGPAASDAVLAALGRSAEVFDTADGAHSAARKGAGGSPPIST